MTSQDDVAVAASAAIKIAERALRISTNRSGFDHEGFILLNRFV